MAMATSETKANQFRLVFLIGDRLLFNRINVTKPVKNDSKNILTEETLDGILKFSAHGFSLRPLRCNSISKSKMMRRRAVDSMNNTAR